jgi:hypothetical protein
MKTEGTIMKRQWRDAGRIRHRRHKTKKNRWGEGKHTHTHTTYDETHQIPEMNQGACKG